MPTLSVRLTPTQYQRLEKEANAAGLTRGSLLKKSYFGKDYTPRRVPRPDQVQLSMVLSQLGKVGSNINQIAKKFNTGQIPPNPEIIKTMEIIQIQFEEIGNQVKEAINV